MIYPFKRLSLPTSYFTLIRKRTLVGWGNERSELSFNYLIRLSKKILYSKYIYSIYYYGRTKGLTCLRQYGMIVLEVIKMIYDSLRGYLRTPTIVPNYSSGQSTHEAIKAQLYVLGYRLGFTPILEGNGNDHKDNTRIDCLILKDRKPICGIEIDYSIKAASIRKLCQLAPGVEKIIISYGSEAARSKAIYRHKQHLKDIKHFILYPA